MYSDPTVYAATMALAWFLMGLVMGRRLEVKPAKAVSRGKKEDIEIYVGNLPYNVKEKDLRREFGKFGAPSSVRIIKNRMNGKSKGYGFVEMTDRGQANKAIRSLNGRDMKGRKIVVNEAKTRSRDD
jgi:RNA recognition motif-containing protein